MGRHSSTYPAFDCQTRKITVCVMVKRDGKKFGKLIFLFCLPFLTTMTRRYILDVPIIMWPCNSFFKNILVHLNFVYTLLNINIPVMKILRRSFGHLVDTHTTDTQEINLIKATCPSLQFSSLQ